MVYLGNSYRKKREAALLKNYYSKYLVNSKINLQPVNKQERERVKTTCIYICYMFISTPVILTISYAGCSYTVTDTPRQQMTDFSECKQYAHLNKSFQPICDHDKRIVYAQLSDDYWVKHFVMHYDGYYQDSDKFNNRREYK